MRIGRLLVAGLAAWLLGWPALAIATPPVATQEAIERLTRDVMAQQQIPGVSIAIVHENRVVYLAGYGFAQLVKQPATADTVYRLASISKTFTAIAAMQLVERKALDLDGPVQAYVPSFPVKRWPITTRQLLAHTSGIRHYQGREILSSRRYTDSLAPLAIFKDDALEHEPGTKYHYSTYGFNLIGAVVESIAQERFPEYVRRQVFEPAGMRHAQVDDIRVTIPNRATGYEPIPGGGGLREAPSFDATNKIPGGGFVATASDLAQFAIAVMTDRLLQRATTGAMWTHQTTKDGAPIGRSLGWALGQWNRQRTASHGGSQPGVSTMLFLVPDRGCGVAVLTNRGGAKGLGELARTIADLGCR